MNYDISKSRGYIISPWRLTFLVVERQYYWCGLPYNDHYIKGIILLLPQCIIELIDPFRRRDFFGLEFISIIMFTTSNHQWNILHKNLHHEGTFFHDKKVHLFPCDSGVQTSRMTSMSTSRALQRQCRHERRDCFYHPSHPYSCPKLILTSVTVTALESAPETAPAKMAGCWLAFFLSSLTSLSFSYKLSTLLPCTKIENMNK